MKLEKAYLEPDGSKGPPNIKECDLCCLHPRRCSTFPCQTGEYYRIDRIAEEEPVKIQTEYDLIKQAHDQLNNLGGSHI